MASNLLKWIREANGESREPSLTHTYKQIVKGKQEAFRVREVV